MSHQKKHLKTNSIMLVFYDFQVEKCNDRITVIFDSCFPSSLLPPCYSTGSEE